MSHNYSRATRCVRGSVVYVVQCVIVYVQGGGGERRERGERGDREREGEREGVREGE